MSDLRVVIIAEDPLTRAGLALLLSDQPGYTVVDEVGGNANLAAALDANHPDVVVWDLGWNPDTVLAHLADLGGDGPPILVLLPDEEYVPNALAAGARGLLLRDVTAPNLMAGLSAIAGGLVALDPRLVAEMPLPRDRGPEVLVEELTPRESEVLRHLAEGLSNRAIAELLGISEHTVKFHVNAILGKLGAQSRTEAVARAARLGLIIL